MDKVSTDVSTGGASIATTTTTTETRTLRDVVHNSKRSGGNYGSLAKSKTQSIVYISHKIESNDTLQRLALKYSISVQEIKRINKLWSDAELGLREIVYIPINSTDLSTLQIQYPNLEIIQDLSPLTGHHQKSLPTNDEINSSDNSTSNQTTNNSSYQDYLSKIDQQIRSTKNSLQSLDQYSTSQPSPSSNDGNSSENTRTTIDNNDRHKGVHHLSDNSVFVNISSKISRDKHVSAALKRLEQEKDNSDEL